MFTVRSSISGSSGPLSHTKRPGVKICLGFLMLFVLQIAGGQSNLFFTQSQDIRLELVDLPETGIVNRAQVITQDSTGFIWIGTSEGLVRYDGHRVKRFFYDPKTPGSVSDNDISSIYQNDPGYLWVGTFLNGFNKLNLATDSAQHYLDSLQVNVLTGDGAGNIWGGTADGIFCFNPSTDSLSQFRPHPEETGEGKNHVWALTEDSKGTIWVGTGPLVGGKGGLYSFLPESNQFTHHKLQVDGGENFSRVPVISLLEDSYNNLWVGTSRGLLFRKNLQTGNIREIFLDPPLDSTIWISNLLEDLDRNVWIATVDQGLYLYDPKSGRQKHFSANSDDCTLPSDLAWCIFQSRDSVFWLGSAKQGETLSKFYLDPSVIHDHPIPGLSTYAFAEGETPGEIWIGTDDGLILYDLAKGIQRHYPAALFLPQGTMGVVAHSLCRDDQGNIWAGLIDKRIEDSPGLLRFNPYTKEFTIFSHREDDVGSLSHNWVFDVLCDRSGRIWAGTHGGGLNLYVPETESFIHYRHHQDQPQSLQEDFIISIFEDRQGEIWISGYMSSVYPAPDYLRIKFLNRFDPNQETYLHIDIPPPYRRTNRSFEGISQDRQGSIWLQTRDEGLIRLDSQGDMRLVYKPFQSYQNVISSLMHDDQLWIIREGSLFRCDPAERRITSEMMKYGGSVDEIDQFYFSTPLLTSSETLLTGGNQFFYEVKTSAFDKINSSKVVYSDLRTFDTEGTSSVQLYNALGKKRVVLSHAENNFSLSFFLDEYRNPQGHSFEYIMEGFDDKWQRANYLPEVVYNKVPPGRYQMKVRAEDSHFSMSDENVLSIEILPPWSQRWWAYTLYIMSGILILTSIYLFQRRRWLLQTQLQLEQEKASRLKELDDFKNRFYTNITHEFRTPLTVIKGMADHILGQEKVKGLIKRNSDQLLTMVNQLLDLTKIESGSLSINWVHGDIIPYLQYLTESCHSLAMEKRISLSFFAKEEKVDMDFDENIIQHILINLVSNAIKFTNDYGSVKVIADVDTDGPAFDLVLSIQDTGLGIPATELEQIFNRYYQVDKTSTSKEDGKKTIVQTRQGSGVGLALVKELVQILEGRIEVQSEHGKGSKFIVHLPIHHDTNKDLEPKVLTVDLIGETDKVADAQPFLKPTHSSKQRSEILVIEDNTDVREYIIMCLQSKYVLHTARNGKEGIDKARDLVPDVIISDIMMPEMDGFDVCRMVKSDRRTSHIPVILLTAKATTEDKISGLTQGADAYLTKPFNKEELLLRIDNLISFTNTLRKRLAASPDSLEGLDNLEQLEIVFIKEVNEVIETNMQSEMFDTHQLCRAVAMSRTQLHRKLSALTGQPTASYIRTIRLRKARFLLERTDQAIAEIAMEVGYKDPSHFSRSFMKEFGMLPSDIRSKFTD